MSFFNLMQQLWQDDCGGIITSEYLLLGSVMTVGTVSGMTAMRDATVDEMKETGNTMRAVREHYTPKFQNNQRNGPSTGYGNHDAPNGKVVCEGATCSVVP